MDAFKASFMKYFVDVLKNSYFEFSGRVSRRNYWMFALFCFLIHVALGIVISIIPAFSFVDTLLSLALFIPGLGLALRRLYDTNRGPLNFLWVLFPIVGWIILIVYACQKGTVGANRYGPDPLAGNAATPSAPTL